MKIGCEDFGWGVGKGQGGVPDSKWLVITVTKIYVALTEESTQENGLQKWIAFLLKRVILG